MNKDVNRMVELMCRSKNTVVVTGAGISTEAGIPDFRGENGIYRRLGENRVMSIINIDFFHQSPDEFYQFYRQYFTFSAVGPSRAHLALAKMEEKGYIRSIVTQNIDNLHHRAGNKNVFAIHGSADRYLCTNNNCQAVFKQEYVDKCLEVVPYCSQCESILKPDVVLFGEPIQHFSQAQEAILRARLLLVIGTSLTVYPLAAFVKEFSTFTQDLIIINKGYTPMDHAATVKIDTGNTGEFLESVMQCLSIHRDLS
jgi:NAD-dependent deacetylase